MPQERGCKQRRRQVPDREARECIQARYAPCRTHLIVRCRPGACFQAATGKSGAAAGQGGGSKAPGGKMVVRGGAATPCDGLA